MNKEFTVVDDKLVVFNVLDPLQEKLNRIAQVHNPSRICIACKHARNCRDAVSNDTCELLLICNSRECGVER